MLRIKAPKVAKWDAAWDASVYYAFAHARHCDVKSILLINQCGLVRQKVKKWLFFFVVPEVLVLVDCSKLL